jgi:hypothetical protein
MIPWYPTQAENAERILAKNIREESRSPELFLRNLGDRRVQCRSKVLIRLGTSPTGITATSLSAVESIAETDRAPELET